MLLCPSPSPCHPGGQFRRLADALGSPFTDPNNGTWSLFFDAVEPYNRVTHSTYVIGIMSNDLPADAYARANNMRVLAIVPGPRAPDNLRPCLIPFLKAFASAAGGDPRSPDAPPPKPITVQGGSDADTFEHIPYLADAKADRMACIKISGVKGPSAYCSCHYCKNQAVAYPGANNTTTLRPGGYEKPVPQPLNFTNPDGSVQEMFFNDPSLLLTPQE